MSWNRAMDEVRIERLMERHGRDTLCVIIKDWSASENYKEKPVLAASLEYLVCKIKHKMSAVFSLRSPAALYFILVSALEALDKEISCLLGLSHLL